MHYAVPRILSESGNKVTLITDFAYKVKAESSFVNLMQIFLPKNLRSRLIDFNCKLEIDYFLSLVIWFTRIIYRNDPYKGFTIVGKLFCKRALKKIPDNVDLIYAFNGAALEVFEKFQNTSVCLVLEQCIAPREVELDILRRHHGFSVEKRTEKRKSNDVMIHREKKELSIASKVIVPSSFVLDCLNVEIVNKLFLVPYGFENDNITAPIKQNNGRLKFLFVGEVGFRKGADLILSAARLCPDMDFYFIGEINKKLLAEYNNQKNVFLLGRKSFSDVVSFYKSSDVFVLPSLVEGSATVIFEAMSYSMPIICTYNTGSTMINEINGLLVETGSVESLLYALNRYNYDRLMLKNHSFESLKLSKVYNLENYKRNLTRALN